MLLLSDNNNVKFNKYNYIKYISLFFISIIIVFTITYNFVIRLDRQNQDINKSAQDNLSDGISLSPENYVLVTDVDYDIDLSIYNSDYSEPPTSLNYLQWDAIAEPYRINTAEVNSFTIDNQNININNDNYIYQWKINDQTLIGKSVSFQIDNVGILSAELTILSTLTNDMYIKSFTIACKYIRREIRSLTDYDRNEFFKTLHKLYEYTNEEGKQLYGDKFNNAEYFLYKHLNGAARTDCDHWHDGPGIVNQHVALTLEVEQSLQSINPAISLPYWEYSMDSYLYSEWQDSEIFLDDWFGDNSPSTSDHSLSIGLWNDIETPDGLQYQDDWSISTTGSLNPFVNSLGHMRSPWNNNPSKQLGRYNHTYGSSSAKIPTCEAMSNCYSSSSLELMFNCLNGDTHGPVHIVVGGCWGQDEEMFSSSDLSFLNDLVLLLYFKLLWRQGYARCPSYSTCMSTGLCDCYIPDEYISTYGSKKILQLSGLYDKLENRLTKDTDDYYTEILKAIEKPYSVGEMFSSGASYDPIFWPVHGQIERVIGLKRIKKSLGEVSLDETWGFVPTETNFLTGRCDWSQVTSPEDLTLPTCDFSDDITCYGHGIDDLLDFKNFINQNELYTNSQFYDFIHPFNDDLPYVYDTYDFDYCEGYSFG